MFEQRLASPRQIAPGDCFVKAETSNADRDPFGRFEADLNINFSPGKRFATHFPGKTLICGTADLQFPFISE